MCGIAFIVNYSKRPIEPVFFQELWEELSTRGTDASGYYFERKSGNGITRRLIKANLPSKILWKKIQEQDNGKQYRLNGHESLVMMHCRLRTKGTEENNLNNMPIHSKNYILIHNGIIQGDHGNKNYTYQAEVDSEEILSNVEQYGITNGIFRTKGSMAIAIKPIKKPELYIYKNTNPLVMLYSAKRNCLVGISNPSYVPEVFLEMNPTTDVFEPRMTIYSVEPNTIFKLNLKKPKLHIVMTEDEYKDAIINAKLKEGEAKPKNETKDDKIINAEIVNEKDETKSPLFPDCGYPIGYLND